MDLIKKAFVKFSKIRGRSRILMLLAVVMLFGTLSGCFLVPKEEQVLAPPLKEPPKITYDYVELKKGTFVKETECTGYYISAQQKDLSFENQAGRLKAVCVKMGDTVKAGQLLAQLNTDNLENQIEQQKIVLEKSQLAYDTVQSNYKKDIDEINIQLEKLNAQLNNMTSILDVYSKNEIDGVREQIKEQETLKTNTSSTYEIALKTAESDIELSKLQLENLNENFNDSRLVSPIDGTIDFVTDAIEGEYVDAYKTIVRVADPKNLQIQYSDDRVEDFELGMAVSLKSGNDTSSGVVVATPANMPVDADEKVRKSIRIKPDKIPTDVKIGDSAEITVILAKKDDVIAIQKNLIHTVGERKYVYVLEDNIRKERDVEVGLENTTEIEIVKGVSEGDKLIKD